MADFDFLKNMNDAGYSASPITESRPAPALDSNPQDVGAMISEAERRFAKAKYYEVLIKEPIFNEDTSAMALEVVKEIQDFSRERLSILLGIKSERALNSEEFTQEEVDVLKQFVAKITKKPELAGFAPATPTLRRAEAPKAPSLAKAAIPEPRKEDKKVAVKSQSEPSVPKRGKSTDTGETIEIPQADNSTRKYRKMTAPDGTEFWYGENGNKYLLKVNDVGQNYMESIQRQTRPANAPTPIPRLNDIGMANVAANHDRQMSRSLDTKLLTAAEVAKRG